MIDTSRGNRQFVGLPIFLPLLAGKSLLLPIPCYIAFAPIPGSQGRVALRWRAVATAPDAFDFEHIPALQAHGFLATHTTGVALGIEREAKWAPGLAAK